MTQVKFKKQLMTAAAGAALALGAATQAVAAPYFTYDFDGVEGGSTVFANAVNGGSSDYLTAISDTEFSGVGWAQFDAFKLDSATVAGTSYADTGLYTTFSLTTELATGVFGASNSTYNVTAFSFGVYRDVDGNNSFIQGDASNGTSASVGNTGSDVLLANGSLLFGDAGLHSTFGASINVATDFALTSDGKMYFIDPVPFYEFALAGFNSTGGNWFYNAETGALSIGSATGIVDFQIPEPGTMALLGLGLIGLGLGSRRRKQ